MFGPAQCLLCRPLLVFLLLLCGDSGQLLASQASANAAATIVDINLRTGAMTSHGPDPMVATPPGSTLKPIILLLALRARVVAPSTYVVCTGSLRVAGRNLACAHPASLADLNAREALAYSCNSYFARLAQQLPQQSLLSGLQQFGLDSQDRSTAPEQRILLALGLAHIRVSATQLARAYVVLARALQADDPAARTVVDGLADSVSYGMAHAAQTAGLTVLGKTGTAHDPAPIYQHGWFAGIVYDSSAAKRQGRVLVVYLPGGSGNDAAAAAHRYLQEQQ